MKKLKILLVVIFVICTELTLIAQNPTQKSFYWENKSSYNPAFYGIEDNFSVQFQTSLGAKFLPNYSLVNLNGQVMKSLGIGATLNTENFGNLRNTFMYGGVSYGFFSKNNVAINMGMSLGYMNSSFNNVEYDINKNVDLSDPFLSSGGISSGKFTMGTGVAVSSKRFLVGLSLPVLLKDGGKINPFTTFYGNINFAISPNLLLSPMILMDFNIQNKYFSGDFATKLKWDNTERAGGMTLLVGGNTRQQLYVAPSFLWGYFEVGYSFRASLGDFKEFDQFMHEISLSFSLGKSTFRQVDLRDKYGYRKGKM